MPPLLFVVDLRFTEWLPEDLRKRFLLLFIGTLNLFLMFLSPFVFNGLSHLFFYIFFFKLLQAFFALTIF